MNHQRAIGATKMREKMGQAIEVIIDEVDAEERSAAATWTRRKSTVKYFWTTKPTFKPGIWSWWKLTMPRIRPWGNLAQ